MPSLACFKKHGWILLPSFVVLVLLNLGKLFQSPAPDEAFTRHPKKLSVAGLREILRNEYPWHGDDHLFFHYTQLLKGRPADLVYVATKRTTTVEALRV